MVAESTRAASASATRLRRSFRTTPPMRTSGTGAAARRRDPSPRGERRAPARTGRSSDRGSRTASCGRRPRGRRRRRRRSSGSARAGAARRAGRRRRAPADAPGMTSPRAAPSERRCASLPVQSESRRPATRSASACRGSRRRAATQSAIQSISCAEVDARRAEQSAQPRAPLLSSASRASLPGERHRRRP